MKAKVTFVTFLSVALALGSIAWLQSSQADEPKETPAVIQAVGAGQVDAMYAEVAQEGEGGGETDLAAAYSELRKLARDHKQAKSKDAKQQILVRAEEFMGQIFTARMQKEHRRIEAEEQRLNHERDALKEMQAHKQDLVHQGVARFFETGEPPEWATQK